MAGYKPTLLKKKNFLGYSGVAIFLDLHKKPKKIKNNPQKALKKGQKYTITLSKTRFLQLLCKKAPNPPSSHRPRSGDALASLLRFLLMTNKTAPKPPLRANATVGFFRVTLEAFKNELVGFRVALSGKKW